MQMQNGRAGGRKLLGIGLATMACWAALAALPAAIETVGGIRLQASAWAQPKDGAEKDGDKGGAPDQGGMQQPPAPNPNAGYLGAKFQGISDEMADEMKLDSQIGVIVMELLPKSPAAADGGLQVKDVIRQMDGKPVEDVPAFVKVMRATTPGQVMKFGVLRGGKPMDITITLGKRPAGMTATGLPPSTGPTTKP